MSRPVAGLACRIRVPVRQYDAVAVLMRDERRHVIRLMHRDAGLSIDVEEFATLETAEEYRDRLARFLDLPPMLMAGAPASDNRRAAADPQPRRGTSVRRRRPRFLARRRSGARGSLAKIEGREIIART